MPSIEELVTTIESFAKEKVSSEKFTTTVEELKSQIEKRNKDVEEELTKKYGDMDERMKNAAKEFEEKLTAAVKEMGKTFKNSVSGDGKEKPDEKIYGKDIGNFLWKVKTNSPELKTLSENTGADGGYLVPDYWANEILKISIEESVIRNIGPKTFEMPGPKFDIPAIKSTSQSGSVYGGVITYWGNESTNLSNNKTAPKFGKISLNANKLYGYTESYEDMTMDAMIAIGPLLQEIFGDAIGFEEDYQFINGNGVGKPLGVVNAPCRATVSRGTASQIHTTDVVGMMARFSGKLDKAVWIVNQTTLTQILTLQDAAGNYILFPGMSGNLAGVSPGSLYGIPIILSEKAQALGTEGDIILGDWSNYIIGDLHGLRVEESKEYKFGEDIKCWKVVKRVEGKPWLDSTITPKHGNTLSPFVLLT
jgi:HK97 family phage major capsid protein